MPANRPADEEVDGELDLLGEGGDDGHIEPGRSVVFATLEVCLCVLVRHYPDLSPRAASINSVMAMQVQFIYVCTVQGGPSPGEPQLG